MCSSDLENKPVGTAVQGLAGVRPTLDPRRKLKYEIISGDGKGLFHISTNESTNGFELVTTKELDREAKKEYSIVIKAFDLLGVDAATTKIAIEIDNENVSWDFLYFHCQDGRIV